jgi:hypothetical protein
MRKSSVSSQTSFDHRTTGIAEGGHDASFDHPACFEQPYAKL